MIYPTKEEFLDSKRNSASYIPVKLEMNADLMTPIGLFYSLKGEKKFLLESAECGKSWGRYSLLGFTPYLTIKSYGEEVWVGDRKFIGSVLDVLKEVMGRYEVSETKHGLPFFGGAVGYVGYDVARQYLNIKSNNKDDLNLPDAYLMLYKEVLVYDHFTHRLYIIHNVLPGDDRSYDEIVKKLLDIKEKIQSSNACITESAYFQTKGFESNFDEQEFVEVVDKAKKYIELGDVFQVVLSQRFIQETNIEPFDAYRKLRTLNPSPYMFHIDFGDFQVVGSSPESLVKVKDGVVATNPIAGTRKRGRNEEEDNLLREELLNDAKERAEHVMLVDLGRNDLGKVCKFGSVKVDKYMEIEMYSHVMHIVSTISGQLQEGKDCFDALYACLPAGTVSGAPKPRAMEIIDGLENVSRGIYAGSIGYFDFSGNMDMCIAIRTIVFKDRKACIQAGCGIVYDSCPEREYEEIQNKAKALKEVLG